MVLSTSSVPKAEVERTSLFAGVGAPRRSP